jgi:hypothetical protein
MAPARANVEPPEAAEAYDDCRLADPGIPLESGRKPDVLCWKGFVMSSRR